MPSKLLIAAADAAHETQRAAEFGIVAANVHVDGRKVMARVRALRDEFVGSVVEGTEELPHDRRPRGRARFVGPTTLHVGDELEVHAKSIVIATGSSPAIPPPFRGLEDDLLTSRSVFELESLPESVAVIGTGPVGLELGQSLSRLGVRVAFFDQSRSVGPFTDPIVREYAIEKLQAELDLRLGTSITEITRAGDEFELAWQGVKSANQQRERFSNVLLATGRKPNIAELNLEATGLPLDERGMPPWNPHTTQCGNSHIFLAGDANDYRPLLHEASDEGRIAGYNSARYPEVTSNDRRTPLAIVFTDPQMAVVGRGFEDLDLESTEIAEVSFENQGRARVMAANVGKVRLYASCENCSLIGAEMFGPRVEHMSHLLVLAVQQQLSVQQILQMPVYHPVLEEGLRAALRDLAKALRVDEDCGCKERGESPGM
jgi:dihydrolipoamide dehydrogenase